MYTNNEKKDNITLVTAFFPINREEWTGFERSNNKYIEYFKFWARMKNDLIVYTTPGLKDEIEKVRKDYGLENKTKVVAVDDFRKIDKELYKSIKKASECILNSQFHINSKNPESWNAEYDYLMILKQWFVKDAVEKNWVKGMVAWIDFGYNHGNEYYLCTEDFNFEWKFNFSDKIHVFFQNEDDNLPVFEVVRTMSTYITGGILVAPDYLWINFWKMMKENMMKLNSVGLIDDDQTILLMSYRQNKQLFEAHKCNWFSVIDDCSDREFSVRKEEKKFVLYRKIKHYIGWRAKVIRYLRKWYKIIKEETTKG